MKKLRYLVFLCLLLPLGLLAQNWETNIDTALTKATNEDKHIILVFSGMDWCVPCVKMERNIWQKPEFQTYANENLIMLKADFPKKRKGEQNTSQIEHNEKLKDLYNTKGLFPYIVLMNKEGESIGHTMYKNIEVSKYIGLINQIISDSKN